MDARAAKLALARQKLKTHQEKKGSDVKTTGNNNDCTSLVFSTNSKDTPDVQTHENSIQSNNFSQSYTNTSDISLAEMLISSKQDLEAQVHELQSKLAQLENNYSVISNNYNYAQHKIIGLENELQTMQTQYAVLNDNLKFHEKTIRDLKSSKLSLTEENNNLLEQLEYTKMALSAKEAENVSLNKELCEIKTQLEATQLQLQQLVGSALTLDNVSNSKNDEALTEKISTLEQQIQLLQKEREQINVHYEHYVGELNNQLRFITTKNEDLNNQILKLSQRENSLVEQLSEMEIRLQNYQASSVALNKDEIKKNIDFEHTQEKYKIAQEEVTKMKSAIEQLQHQLKEREEKIQELHVTKVAECNHDVIEYSKLNADITSDKIAAQRATEQNKKLKIDLQELEQAFVKMSQDKLDLTEKLTAEKYLNRELTIKLAEIDEKAKELNNKLKAKDDEMIRLQANHRGLEIKLEELMKNSHTNMESKDSPQTSDITETLPLSDEINENQDIDHKTNCEHNYLLDESRHHNLVKKEEAMHKLQERFLKIMDDLATLADEKHQLEHINLQLQSETETICEYIALYQQQRSLLKKRDEERSTQIKLFQTECDQLRNNLDELTKVLQTFLEDKNLVSYFETKHTDVNKVVKLLSDLKNNLLIDPNRNKIELKNFYPCSCCSGQLIDV